MKPTDYDKLEHIQRIWDRAKRLEAIDSIKPDCRRYKRYCLLKRKAARLMHLRKVAFLAKMLSGRPLSPPDPRFRLSSGPSK